MLRVCMNCSWMIFSVCLHSAKNWIFFFHWLFFWAAVNYSSISWWVRIRPDAFCSVVSFRNDQQIVEKCTSSFRPVSCVGFRRVFICFIPFFLSFRFLRCCCCYCSCCFSFISLFYRIESQFVIHKRVHLSLGT